MSQIAQNSLEVVGVKFLLTLEVSYLQKKFMPTNVIKTERGHFDRGSKIKYLNLVCSSLVLAEN